MIASYFECGGKYVKFFNFVAIFAKRLKGPKLLSTAGDSNSKLLPMEIPIPNFCPWNRHDNSKSKSSEPEIPLPWNSQLGIDMVIP